MRAEVHKNSDKELNQLALEKAKRMKEKVTVHAKKMRVKADPRRAKCVDGGYRGNEAVGAIAIPGGHLGISMALLSLGFSPQDAFKMVYDFTHQNGNPYSWHTDKHEGHDGVVVGCGHCNAAIAKGKSYYDVQGEKVSELLAIVRDAQANMGDMDCVILDREHKEEAILVITSTDYTVKPWDQDNDVQFFIYDKTRHLILLEQMVEFWDKAKNIKVDYKKLVEACEKQTNATLGLLGSSKGKPIYTVDVSSEEPVVEEAGTAPVFKE